MKKLSVLILTCIILTANNSLRAISPTKIFSNVKNKVTAWLYQQEEVSKHEIKCTPSQKRVVVQNANGNIKIKTWKQDGIIIKMVNRAYSQDDLQKITSSIDTSDNETIFIKAKVPSNLTNKSSIDYELLIPQEFALRCSTGRGNIKVKHCNGLIQATTDDGQIELHHTSGKVCAASNNNGAIIIHHASGPLQVSTNNGNIFLEEANNSSCATATNGCISMSSTALSQKASVHLTASGSIDLILPKNSSAHILAKSKNGTVISNHLIKIKPHETKLNKSAWKELKHNIEGTIGTGKAEIILHAHNGSIKILEAEKAA